MMVKVLANCDYRLIKRKGLWAVLKDGHLELAQFETKDEAHIYLLNYLKKLGFNFDYRILICGYEYYYYEDKSGKRIRVHF